MQQANRPYPLKVANNLRSLGGYAADGGVTRNGVAFRADGLTDLPAEDIKAIAQLGIDTVIDLRSAEECQRKQNSLKDVQGMRYAHVPLLDGIFSDGETPSTLAALYVAILDHMQSGVAKALREVLNAKGGAVFHCSAGKDRTGVVAMLLLSLAGVPRETIVADYAATHGYMEKRFAAMRAEADESMPDFLFRSDPENMETALDHLQAAYGGILPYLNRIGLSEEEIRALKKKLLEEEAR